MHMPGLDAFLMVPDERRRRFRCPEDAVAELSAELLADHDRMRALFEEDATTQDVSELVEELIELRFLLSRPDDDPSAARDLEITRRDMATKARKLADAEAQYQVDNA